ncbi:MAG: hypothetical protein EOM54_12705 [Clostridia bacterium]|nr:hypothetical protein [Clostridia bacterium]
MKTQLIVMLTHHDKTVADALDVFNSAKDLDVTCWGFKDVGLPKPDMAELLKAMKDAGKTTFLEIVSYSEEECMRGAKLAVEMGFDYLMGTLFYPSVWAFLKQNNIKYFPFVGKVSGSPSVLEGSIEEIIEEGKKLTDLGVHGFDILAYRYIRDPELLAHDFIAEMKIPVVVAGSINDKLRMQFVEDIGAWAYTMGSALFEDSFIKGSFRDNLEAVCKIMSEVKAATKL